MENLITLEILANEVYRSTGEYCLRAYATKYYGTAETVRENPRHAIEQLARVIMSLDYKKPMSRYFYNMLTKIAPHFGVEIL